MRHHFDIRYLTVYMPKTSHLGPEVSHVTRQTMCHGQLHHCVLGKSSKRQTKTGVKERPQQNTVGDQK